MATTLFEKVTNTRTVDTVVISTARRPLPSHVFAVASNEMDEAADDAAWEAALSSPGFAKLIAQAKSRIAAGKVTPLRIEDL